MGRCPVTVNALNPLQPPTGPATVGRGTGSHAVSGLVDTSPAAKAGEPQDVVTLSSDHPDAYRIRQDVTRSTHESAGHTEDGERARLASNTAQAREEAARVQAAGDDNRDRLRELEEKDAETRREDATRDARAAIRTLPLYDYDIGPNGRAYAMERGQEFEAPRAPPSSDDLVKGPAPDERLREQRAAADAAPPPDAALREQQAREAQERPDAVQAANTRERTGSSEALADQDARQADAAPRPDAAAAQTQAALTPDANEPRQHDPADPDQARDPARARAKLPTAYTQATAHAQTTGGFEEPNVSDVG